MNWEVMVPPGCYFALYFEMHKYEIFIIEELTSLFVNFPFRTFDLMLFLRKMLILTLLIMFWIDKNLLGVISSIL